MEMREVASWGAALADMRRWAATQEGVSVTPTALSVARPVRDEFYGRLGRVQGLLAAEALKGRLGEARSLSRALAAVREGLLSRTGLGAIDLGPRIEQLVEDADSAASEPLFSVALDALSGKVPLAAVDGEARRALIAGWDGLVRGAYEAWAYLGIVAALGPVRFWAVATADGEEAHVEPTDCLRMGWQVPSRERRFPEAVFQCADGRTFAMKCEAAREIDYYDALAPVARDTSAGGNTAGMLGHRVLLLYRLGAPDEVSATVDRKTRVQRPCDLAADVLAPGEMENPSYLGAFIARLRILRTRRPVQVLTFDGSGAFPAAMEADETVPAVERRVVGLDAAALALVAGQLQ